MVIAFIAVYAFRISVITVILCAALVGVLGQLIPGRKEGRA